MSYMRPASRDDFEVAAVCALPLEYDAVKSIFDEFWDDAGGGYGRAVEDDNAYTTGRVGKHNVVLVLLSHMGKVKATSSAANLRSSFRHIRLTLLIGVCGGVPEYKQEDSESLRQIFLGDVVISTRLEQYDYGRQYPDKFVPKRSEEARLGLPSKNVRNILALLRTDRGCQRLHKLTGEHLRRLQARADQMGHRGKYDRPQRTSDLLFHRTYRHRHYLMPGCICRNCVRDSDPICDEATESSCDELGCDKLQAIQRERASDELTALHFGGIASGDTVMKSAAHRDRASQDLDVIAFEMEGAGVWDELPCIVIKGVCDYADSHKHKKWQKFAATSKASLECYEPTDKPATRASFRGKKLAGREDPKADALDLVYRWMCNDEHGPWLLILDNAETAETFFPSSKLRRVSETTEQRSLSSYLPKVRGGSMIVTSRNRILAEKLAGIDNIRRVLPMDDTQASELLRSKLPRDFHASSAEVKDLIITLEFMPLAITQAASFIKQRRPHMQVSNYLDQFRRSKRRKTSLLHSDTGDLRRDDTASNSIIITWEMTFEQIRRERQKAADLLSFMSFFNPQGIPKLALLSYEKAENMGSWNYDRSLDNFYQDLVKDPQRHTKKSTVDLDDIL